MGIKVTTIPRTTSFDPTLPVTQAFGDAPATGTSAFPAHVDHRHGMMADPTVDIRVRAFHNAAQSLANNTDVALALNSERWDTDGMHDNVTNNSRLTCVTAGLFDILGAVGFADNATGERLAYIRLNGTTIIAMFRHTANQTDLDELEVSTQYQLAVNDYVELIARQESGIALNAIVNAQRTPEFMMVKVEG